MPEWLFAMTLALVLGLLTPEQRGQRERVWIVMIVGLPVAHIYQRVWFYMAIDLAIAAAIMMEPKTLWQRIIGLCYIGMALLSLGYLIRLHLFSSPAASPELLKAVNDYLGWAATLVLIMWGGNGVFGTLWEGLWHRLGGGRDLSPVEQRRVR